MTIAGIFVDLVKMDCILLKEIRRCQIGSAAKPPTSLNFSCATLKIPIIGVNCRGHWIVWMENQTDTRGKKIQVLSFKLMATAHFFSSFWTQRSVNNANIDAGFFEDFAL